MFRLFLALFAVIPALALAEPRLGDDGLHKQDWFHQSFLELHEDAAEAVAEGKFLLVLVEQAGCPYCRELHAVNFERPEIVEAMKTHYLTVQLDLWGSREITDIKGQPMEERAWAQANAVNFTPTTIIYGQNAQGELGELFRLPGYLKPFHYLSSLEYVATGEYQRQPFQRYLQDKFAEFKAKGIDPEVW